MVKNPNHLFFAFIKKKNIPNPIWTRVNPYHIIIILKKGILTHTLNNYHIHCIIYVH